MPLQLWKGNRVFFADFSAGFGRTFCRAAVGLAESHGEATPLFVLATKDGARNLAAGFTTLLAQGCEVVAANLACCLTNFAPTKVGDPALPPILAPNFAPAFTTALVLTLAPTTPDGIENLSTGLFFFRWPFLGACTQVAAWVFNGCPFMSTNEGWEDLAAKVLAAKFLAAKVGAPPRPLIPVPNFEMALATACGVANPEACGGCRRAGAWTRRCPGGGPSGWRGPCGTRGGAAPARSGAAAWPWPGTLKNIEDVLPAAASEEDVPATLALALNLGQAFIWPFPAPLVIRLAAIFCGARGMATWAWPRGGANFVPPGLAASAAVAARTGFAAMVGVVARAAPAREEPLGKVAKKFFCLGA